MRPQFDSDTLGGPQTMRRSSIILSFAISCGACANLAAGTWPARPAPIDPTVICAPKLLQSSKQIQVGPKRDPAKIQKTVRSAFNDFRVCYEDALGRKRDATGRVQVRFGIDQYGRVTDACVEPPVLPDGAAVDCILARFNDLKFGNGDQLTVVYPILFAPGVVTDDR
jgi:hypothetical protein